MKFRSLKNYSVGAYKKAMRKLNFPNYEYIEDVNRAYSDCSQKLRAVIDKVAPC